MDGHCWSAGVSRFFTDLSFLSRGRGAPRVWPWAWQLFGSLPMGQDDRCQCVGKAGVEGFKLCIFPGPGYLDGTASSSLLASQIPSNSLLDRSSALAP